MHNNIIPPAEFQLHGSYNAIERRYIKTKFTRVYIYIVKDFFYGQPVFATREREDKFTREGNKQHVILLDLSSTNFEEALIYNKPPFYNFIK